MLRKWWLLGLMLAVAFGTSVPLPGQDDASVQLDNMEEPVTQTYRALVRHKTEPGDVPDRGSILWSNHFVFGTPRIVDRRHDPDSDRAGTRPGISVLVREGFGTWRFQREP